MGKKKYSHKVSMRQGPKGNRALNDLKRRNVSDKAFKYVFDNYYKDQVEALYRAISRNK